MVNTDTWRLAKCDASRRRTTRLWHAGLLNSCGAFKLARIVLVWNFLACVFIYQHVYAKTGPNLDYFIHVLPDTWFWNRMWSESPHLPEAFCKLGAATDPIILDSDYRRRCCYRSSNFIWNECCGSRKDTSTRFQFVRVHLDLGENVRQRQKDSRNLLR